MKTVIPSFKRMIDKKYWVDIFKYMKSGNVDTWDAQWLFSIWKNKGLSITPSNNLVNNIGFGSEATNTILKSKNLFSGIQDDTRFSIMHPRHMEVNELADITTSDTLYRIKNRMKTFNLKIKISRFLPVKYKRKLKVLMTYFN